MKRVLVLSILFLSVYAVILAGFQVLGIDRLFDRVSIAITTIEVSPDSATLTVLGATLQFTAVAKDANGNIVPDVTFLWISSDSTIATVDSTGLATAIANGHVTITAQNGAVTGTATLAVCSVASGSSTTTSTAPPVYQ